MIMHDTIHGKQYTKTLTDEQWATIRNWHLEKDLYFHTDGKVQAILFEQDCIQVFTFRSDGSLLVEERDFTNQGWSEMEYKASGKLRSYRDLDEHDVEHDTHGNKWYGRRD